MESHTTKLNFRGLAEFEVVDLGITLAVDASLGNSGEALELG